MKHIDYLKLSKKNRRLLDRRQRNTWSSIRPVTQIVPSSKIYRRHKIKREVRDLTL